MLGLNTCVYRCKYTHAFGSLGQFCVRDLFAVFYDGRDGRVIYLELHLLFSSINISQTVHDLVFNNGKRSCCFRNVTAGYAFKTFYILKTCVLGKVGITVSETFKLSHSSECCIMQLLFLGKYITKICRQNILKIYKNNGGGSIYPPELWPI